MTTILKGKVSRWAVPHKNRNDDLRRRGNGHFRWVLGKRNRIAQSCLALFSLPALSSILRGFLFLPHIDAQRAVHDGSLIRQLLLAHRLSSFMACAHCVPPGEEIPPEQNQGIVQNHAYTILQVVELKESIGAGRQRQIGGGKHATAASSAASSRSPPRGVKATKTATAIRAAPSSSLSSSSSSSSSAFGVDASSSQYFLLLRNPTGQHVFQDRSASDHKSSWNAATWQLFRPDTLSVGEFWMEWSDFVQYFTRIYVCQLFLSSSSSFPSSSSSSSSSSSPEAAASQHHASCVRFLDEWNMYTAGGCASSPSRRHNPAFQVFIDPNAHGSSQQAHLYGMLQQPDHRKHSLPALPVISTSNSSSSSPSAVSLSSSFSSSSSPYSSSSSICASSSNSSVPPAASKYLEVGVTVVRTVDDSPFLSRSSDHPILQTSFWNKRDVACMLSLTRSPHPYVIDPSTFLPINIHPFC